METGANQQTTKYQAIKKLKVNGREIETDSEGYLRNLDDWSEDFARAQAAQEGLRLTSEHWQVIRFLRDYYQEHGVQAQEPVGLVSRMRCGQKGAYARREARGLVVPNKRRATQQTRLLGRNPKGEPCFGCIAALQTAGCE